MTNHISRNQPQFQKGETLSAAKLNRVADLVAGILQRRRGMAVIDPLPLWVQLTEDLDAGTPLSSSNQATATVWQRASDGNYHATTRTETVVNFSSVAYDVDDYIWIRWLDGAWQPLPSGGDGGFFGEGVITEVDCENYHVTIDADAATTWLSQCVTPPDQVYGDIEIYDPCPDRHGKMAEKTEDEMLGKVVQFWRVFNAYSCEAEYHIIDICFRPGCGDEEV